MRTRSRARPAVLAAAAAAAVVAALEAGCGLNVQSADLFALTRSGEGRVFSIVVNDSGTARCDGGRARRIPDALLIEARDLADGLAADASRGLTIRSAPGTASTFTIRLSQGTVRFPDHAGARHHELADAELFAVRAAALCRPA